VIVPKMGDMHSLDQIWSIHSCWPAVPLDWLTRPLSSPGAKFRVRRDIFAAPDLVLYFFRTDLESRPNDR
jgi:hypothetical protein